MSEATLAVIAKAVRRDSGLRLTSHLVLFVPPGVFFYITYVIAAHPVSWTLFWMPLLPALVFLSLAVASLRKNPLFLVGLLRKSPQRVSRVAFAEQKLKELKLPCILVEFQGGRSFPISVATYHSDPSTDDVIQSLKRLAPQADFTGVAPDDVDVPVELDPHEAVVGCQRTIRKGSQMLTVRIPPGIQSGQQLRLAGQGPPGPFSGGPNPSRGDLYLTINVRGHATS